MRHMPDDTITVTLSEDATTTVFGDPAMPIGAWGGNDSLTATILGSFSVANLIGEDAVLQRNSHGGNDTLVAKRA